MKKEIKIVDGYYNNQEVVVDFTSEHEDYHLVYFKDSEEKSKFKISAGELKQEANGQD